MRISTRIVGSTRSITAYINENLSPRARSKILADTAREERDKAIDQNRRVLGRAPEYNTFVDGVAEAPLDKVKPEGVIVFEFQLVIEALEWIMDNLITHSPVDTTEFSRSHYLFADGTEIANAQSRGPIPPSAAENYTFMSLDKPGKVRSIEKGHSKQTPNGVYEVVAKMANSRFGNQVKIKFSYAAPFHASFKHLRNKERRQAEKDVRVPAIVVTPR